MKKHLDTHFLAFQYDGHQQTPRMKIIEQSLKKWENCNKNSKLQYLTCTEQSQFPNMLEIINLFWLVKHNNIWLFSYWWAVWFVIYCLEKENLHVASKDQNNSQLTHGKGLWPNGFVYFDLHLKHSLNFLRKYGFLGTDVLSNTQLHLRSMEYFRIALSLKKIYKR